MRRYLLRWSLRTALVAVAISGCVLGYVAKVRREWAERERAIAAIDGAGGGIGQRYGYCMISPDRRPVVELTWIDDRATDAELANLAWLPNLSYLYLNSPNVTDAGLAHLASLTKLDRLILTGTPITDAGLARLRGLALLSSLDLSGTKVTDAGLAHLAKMTGLREVALPAAITDAGLARLRGLMGLEMLDLSDTAITDAGLAHLKRMGQLKTLYIDRTRISPAACDGLKRALPGLEIDHY